MYYEPRIRSIFSSPLVEVVDFRCALVETNRVVDDSVPNRSFICFPRRGSFFRHGRGRKDLVDPNHVVFFGAGTRVAISYPRSGGDDSTFFVLSPDLLREVLQSVHPPAGDEENPSFPREQVLSDPGTFLRYRLLLDRIEETDAADTLGIEEMAVDLTRRSLTLGNGNGAGSDRAPSSATRRFHREQVEHVKNLLAEHFHEDLALGDLARAVASSPYHLARIFKREVGVPIHRYLNRLRLRASVDYLSEWKAGLTDLALELGYSSHSHFSEAFRREFGLSPSELRRGVSWKRMAELEGRVGGLH